MPRPRRRRTRPPPQGEESCVDQACTADAGHGSGGTAEAAAGHATSAPHAMVAQKATRVAAPAGILSSASC